jgi:hypothetical protein
MSYELWGMTHWLPCVVTMSLYSGLSRLVLSVLSGFCLSHYFRFFTKFLLHRPNQHQIMSVLARTLRPAATVAFRRNMATYGTCLLLFRLVIVLSCLVLCCLSFLNCLIVLSQFYFVLSVLFLVLSTSCLILPCLVLVLFMVFTWSCLDLSSFGRASGLSWSCSSFWRGLVLV